MTIPSGKGADGEHFAFDADQAAAAGNTIDALAERIRELPRLAQAQSGTPNLGSDRVSKAIADVIAAQNDLITAGAAHLSERLQRAAGNFAFSATTVRETESTSATSLTALPTTQA
ncbi:hypothetical protein Srot_0679 [Segniliparus rotundus DSM 44985]|uniref:PE domain-containing protein n=1 Tax=Segniliparus rotundus (strain ATCC BAA-972 / CDC 1076 / CIP 108378 / DSM 44985 / JCM 13578) TaxID=640132 RepID=D6ZD97_SEGRD|nr:hypothetical protein [Segniliparus rotundus]ADG97161.1 hypothetical protein Srot_0679 [Segniliparus rotundus DSM 44985]